MRNGESNEVISQIIHFEMNFIHKFENIKLPGSGIRGNALVVAEIVPSNALPDFTLMTTFAGSSYIKTKLFNIIELVIKFLHDP